jgi:hypothetical protein
MAVAEPPASLSAHSTPAGAGAGGQAVDDATLASLTAACVDALLGEPATVIAAWWSRLGPAIDGPAPLLRVVYAFDAARLTGLRHWRDEVEGPLCPPVADAGSGAWFVAMEASKWARLLLKRQGGALWTALGPTAFVTTDAAALGALAAGLWDADADAWAASVGLVVARPAAEPLMRPFDAVDAWLTAVRRRPPLAT